MKSKDKLATLCAHKAVAPSWHDLSRQKSYATKRQPFSIYYEKFRIDRFPQSLLTWLQSPKGAHKTFGDQNLSADPPDRGRSGFPLGRETLRSSMRCRGSPGAQLRRPLRRGPKPETRCHRCCRPKCKAAGRGRGTRLDP